MQHELIPGVIHVPLLIPRWSVLSNTLNLSFNVQRETLMTISSWWQLLALHEDMKVCCAQETMDSFVSLPPNISLMAILKIQTAWPGAKVPFCFQWGTWLLLLGWLRAPKVSLLPPIKRGEEECPDLPARGRDSTGVPGQTCRGKDVFLFSVCWYRNLGLRETASAWPEGGHHSRWHLSGSQSTQLLKE